MSNKFNNNEFYHIYNRGVEKRDIFIDEADYFRFILGIASFNDSQCTSNLHRIHDVLQLKEQLIKHPIVEIICYSLMPNHYHILLRQIADNGISRFMQKLGIGYTKYFNKRYNRIGVLFQGVFKAKHISKNEYLLQLSRYIHLNALSLMQSYWLSGGMGVCNTTEAYKFLKEYRWHSLPFILDKKPCLIKLHPGIFIEQFNSANDYMKFIMDWTANDFDGIKDYVIEKM